MEVSSQICSKPGQICRAVVRDKGRQIRCEGEQEPVVPGEPKARLRPGQKGENRLQPGENRLQPGQEAHLKSPDSKASLKKAPKSKTQKPPSQKVSKSKSTVSKAHQTQKHKIQKPAGFQKPQDL